MDNNSKIYKFIKIFLIFCIIWFIVCIPMILITMIFWIMIINPILE